MNRESSRITVIVTDVGSDRSIVCELRAHAFDHRDRVLAHRAADVEHAPPACRRATPTVVGRSKLSSA